MKTQTLWERFRDLNPWRWMLVSLIIMVLYGVWALGNAEGAFKVLVMVLPTGLILDYALHHVQKTPLKGKFPESGLITSLIVSVLMPLQVAPQIAIGSIVLAILSKHFIRYGGEHIFNPASFGVVVVSLFVPFPLAWWPDGYIWLAVILGLVNLWRTRKYFQALTFMLAYLIFLFTFVGDLKIAALSLPFFFICFMLPEPVTSEGGVRGQIVFGLIASIGAVAATYTPQISMAALPAGLMLANVSRFIWKDEAPKYSITPGFVPQK